MRRGLLCIPNFSEGRDPAVHAALVAAAEAAPAVRLLRHEADPDHHRAVLTLAGAPDAVVAAALRLVEVAVARIDLRRHAGVHPRIGAADVVPFVPWGEATMAQAVAAARALGAAVGERLGLPVFLYEEAARAPARRNLAEVRRGGLAGLARRMAADPAWRPDHGPAVPHPTAGAVAIGARFFLVAFNVDLESRDLRLAREIARAVRERDGGMPCVKALGLALAHQGCVQVSLNLTDYRISPPLAVYQEIERRARQAGVAVRASELIGLAPRAALPDDPRTSLNLAGFDPRLHVLEEVLG